MVVSKSTTYKPDQFGGTMRTTLNTLLSVAALGVATQAAAQITLYQDEGFRGPAFSANKSMSNFDRTGYNDRASSAVVERGRWEVCEDARFQGRCVVLQPGNYPSLSSVGMNDRISSVRPVSATGNYPNVVPAPVATPVYEYRQRPNERLYQVPVTDVHAVVGPPQQRCWVDRQQVTENHGGANVPGAIIGAVLGGVLGHQIGNGRGNDIATAGGAVAGAAVGANVGRGGQTTSYQDVQRCENVANTGPPDYWDVGYNYRGVQHRVQMSAPPGPTITVNGNGEPRG
jgi:uncharacterized protein YcfJ